MIVDSETLPFYDWRIPQKNKQTILNPWIPKWKSYGLNSVEDNSGKIKTAIVRLTDEPQLTIDYNFGVQVVYQNVQALCLCLKWAV